MEVKKIMQSSWQWLLGLSFSWLVVSVSTAAALAVDEEFSGEAADNSATAAVEELGPFGGNLWDTAIDSSRDMMYTVAKDSPNGFYRSDDGGATWQGLEGVDYGGGIAVEVDIASGDVYATFSGGVYKSTDQGETFTRIIEESGNGLLFAGDLLLVGGTSAGGTINLSSDGGETFDTITFSGTSDEYIWDIDYTPAGDIYYLFAREQATNENHLYASANSGQTWTEVAIPAELSTVTENYVGVSPLTSDQIIITGGNHTDLFYTLDGGDTWTQSTVASSGVTFDHTGRAWVAEQYSDNGGVSWTAYDDDNTSSAIGGHHITVDPENQNTVIADGMPGLAISVDRGLTWTDSNVGILGITISDISQATDKDYVWAAAYNGIAKTENFTSGNPTWQFPVLEEPGYGIWTDPANPDVAVAGVSSGTRRTTDGGVTWSEYAGTELLESFQVFDEIMNDVSDTSILYAAISNNDPSAAKTGAVLISTDQGISWSDLVLPGGGSAQTITQSVSGTLYVGLGAESDLDGETGIYKYSGGTWEKLTAAPDQDIVKLIADPDEIETVYAVAGQLYNNGSEDSFGFYKTTDGGDTWVQVTTGLEQLRNFTSLALQDIPDANTNTLYLGAENYYGQGLLYKSADGGETWGLQYTGLQDETFYTLMFDGVTIGSTRGMFDIKSKATVQLQLLTAKPRVGRAARLQLSLKDSVTVKKIAQERVKIFRVTKHGKKLVDTVRTNRNGKAQLKLHPRAVKSYRYYAVWTPSDDRAEEYTKSQSSRLKVRVRKAR